MHGQSTLQAILNGLREGQESGRGILPLSSEEERGRMPLPHHTLDRLLTIFRKVCDALAMAHAKGVIHRDLKPENVMVGEFGEVLVMDWGIAKILGDAEPERWRPAGGLEEATVGGTPTLRLPPGFQERSEANLKTDPAESTMDGTVIGTPHYMSPEQATRQVSEIDQQSDVFSLGAILYALLTLHPPVEAASIQEVLERIRRGDIRPPTTFNVTTKTGAKGQSLASAVADHDRKITLLDVRTGERLLEFSQGFSKKSTGSRFSLAFSPDGPSTRLQPQRPAARLRRRE